MLTEKQIGVLKGMAIGMAITLIAIGLAIDGPPPQLAPSSDAPLMFVFRWNGLVVACLAINIAMLARHRFFTPDDIDGGGLTSGTSRAHLLQSTLQNTLEQAVLAIGVHAAWATLMPRTWLAAVPVASMLFVAGRVMFWLGYSSGAPSRALGFALTFYPSVVMLLLIGGNIALTGSR